MSNTKLGTRLKYFREGQLPSEWPGVELLEVVEQRSRIPLMYLGSDHHKHNDG